MNRFITLREVCEKSGVSRRAVQGYEKEGLVAPSGRNKYGHLLYDEETQQKIAEIHLFQRLGFKVKEINDVMHAPTEVKKEQLEEKIIALKKEEKDIAGLIQQAQDLIRTIEKRTEHD